MPRPQISQNIGIETSAALHDADLRARHRRAGAQDPHDLAGRDPALPEQFAGRRRIGGARVQRRGEPIGHHPRPGDSLQIHSC